MSKNQILIIGAGGHSKVVTEIINSLTNWEIVAYLDEGRENSTFLPRPVVKTIDDAKKLFPTARNAFVAIGSNPTRRKWHEVLKKNSYTLPWFSHKSACISPSASIGPGSLLAAQTVAGPNCSIDEGVIVNTGAILDHDTAIGSFTHIGQGAIACGGARINSDVLIGPGCVIEKMATVLSGSSTPPNAIIIASQQDLSYCDKTNGLAVGLHYRHEKTYF